MSNEIIISEENLIGRAFWYVIEIWGTLCTVPVTVKSVSADGELTVVWQITDEYSEEYGGVSSTELCFSRQDATDALKREIETLRKEWERGANDE